MTASPEPVSRGRMIVLLLGLAAAGALVLTDQGDKPEVVNVVPRAPLRQPDTAADLQKNLPRAKADSSSAIVPLRARGPRPAVQDAFAVRTWRKPVAVIPQIPAPVPAPVAPALPYTFLGKQYLAGQWEVFLNAQGRTMIVRLGDTLDGAWRVQALQPPTLTLVHLPTSEQKSLPIGEGG